MMRDLYREKLNEKQESVIIGDVNCKVGKAENDNYNK